MRISKTNDKIHEQKSYHFHVRRVISLCKKFAVNALEFEEITFTGSRGIFFISVSDPYVINKNYRILSGLSWSETILVDGETGQRDEKRMDFGTRCAGAAEVLEEALGF